MCNSCHPYRESGEHDGPGELVATSAELAALRAAPGNRAVEDEFVADGDIMDVFTTYDAVNLLEFLLYTQRVPDRHERQAPPQAGGRRLAVDHLGRCEPALSDSARLPPRHHCRRRRE
jgi:hypothetical protein